MPFQKVFREILHPVARMSDLEGIRVVESWESRKSDSVDKGPPSPRPHLIDIFRRGKSAAGALSRPSVPRFRMTTVSPMEPEYVAR